VDEVIALFEDHRKTQYAATQINGEINAVQVSFRSSELAVCD
jgi:seryl-tRNA synthetase